MKINHVQAVGQEFDVCIVGAGPAGISVALEIERVLPRARILLLEFGGPDGGPQNLLDDKIVITNPQNHHPPEECTNKGFGGSSATWGGRCVMYDEVDFLPRPVVAEHCTWDPEFSRAVQPYLRRAAEVLECGVGPFDLAASAEGNVEPMAEGFLPGDVTDTVIERWSRPTRFAQSYREAVENSSAIHLLLGARASRFKAPDEAGSVRQLQVRMLKGEEIVVLASRFIVAAGAQESTRLLLRSPEIFPRGRLPDALGRFYQGHVSGKIASVQFHGNARRTEYGFRREPDGVYVRRRFQFPAATLVRENLLNTAIWLDNPPYADPAHGSGALSLMYLAMITPGLGRRLAPPAIAHSVTKGKVQGIPRHLANVVRGIPSSLLTPLHVFVQRYFPRRKLPGVFLYSPQNRYALHFHAEQVPRRENRMELDSDGETLRIHYDLCEADVESVVRCHEILDRHLRDCGCGHLDYWFQAEAVRAAIHEMSRDGIHQSGTTRIADSPERGVVSRDLRVFGTNNVFVCSSSVLPTSGQANPTFFLCALAIRLAHQLSRE